MKKGKQKHCYRWLIIGILLVGIGSGSYVYYRYAMDQREKENPTTLTETSTKERYSITRIVSTLSIFPQMRENAFKSHSSEQDYGTYVIPGLEATKTLNDDQEVEMCTSMTPQGIAVIDNYVLVSSYCHTRTHNTVIYVMNKTTHEFIKEVILPGRPHGGSIAYDPVNRNIFICSKSNQEAQVVSFSLEDLESYSFQEENQPIAYRYKEKIQTISSNSFMTYYKGFLYMGYFSETDIGLAEKFKILPDGTLIEGIDKDVDDEHPIALLDEAAKIPENVQGITFAKDKLLFSISNGPYNPSSLELYNNGEGVDVFNDENVYKKIKMPERMEQIYIDGNDLYVLFESASNAYHALSLTPCDRVIKLNLEHVLQ